MAGRISNSDGEKLDNAVFSFVVEARQQATQAATAADTEATDDDSLEERLALIEEPSLQLYEPLAPQAQPRNREPLWYGIAIVCVAMTGLLVWKLQSRASAAGAVAGAQVTGSVAGVDWRNVKVTPLDSDPAPDPAPVRPQPKRIARAPLSPSTATPPTTPLGGEGTLVLSTEPWSEVTVDDVSSGPTPVTLKVSAGPHTIRFSNPEFHIDRRMDVTVGVDQTVRKRLVFSP